MTMFLALVRLLARAILDREKLVLEILALRQQIAMLKPSIHGRVPVCLIARSRSRCPTPGATGRTH